MRLTLSLLVFLSPFVLAGKADVIDVDVSCETGDADRVCRFSVTIRHGDAGWAHYANKWDVLTTDGRLLGTRELLHPHDNEQPFTRSLSGVAVPADVDEVIIRAHDSVHGYGGMEAKITVQ